MNLFVEVVNDFWRFTMNATYELTIFQSLKQIKKNKIEVNLRMILVKENNQSNK